MEKLPFKEERIKASRPLYRIHTDTMGPIKPTAYPGRKRLITVCIDDYTGLARLYTMKYKNEAGHYFQRFLCSARNWLGKDEKVSYVRADQGTEFTDGEFSEIMQKEEMEEDFSSPYTPEHNKTAERFNKTI